MMSSAQHWELRAKKGTRQPLRSEELIVEDGGVTKQN